MEKKEPMKSKLEGLIAPGLNKQSFNGRENDRNVEEWELRPGGMLVQKRDALPNQNSVPPKSSTIKVRVKFASSRHEIRISPQSSFGELKKMLAECSGVHHLDQKLIYKKKERDSKEYLDVARVKDGSKIELIEDVTSRARRSLEMVKSARIEKASKCLQQICFDVGKLVEKVKSLEKSRGIEVAEVDKLTEMLMSKLVALDGIADVGDLKLQKGKQEKRVQRYIETLDMLKLKSGKTNIVKESKISLKQQDNSNGNNTPNPNPNPRPKQDTQQPKQRNVTVQKPMQEQQPIGSFESVIVTTKWVTFD